MKEISLEELKELQLDILTRIHVFCSQNGIRYFLDFGTLLGAIRHKGYIPWDDDIDISMPRPDYDRFVQSFNGHYKDLTVIAPELDWSYYAPYANVYNNKTLLEENTNHKGSIIGIKVDIFPIEGVPTDELEYSKHIAKINQIVNAIAIKKWDRNYFRRSYRASIKSFIASCIVYLTNTTASYSKLQKQLRRQIDLYPFQSAQYAERLVFHNKKDKRQPKELFEKYTIVKFEGCDFYAPENYDVLLNSRYGDYMVIPNDKEKVQYHGFKAYWKD